MQVDLSVLVLAGINYVVIGNALVSGKNCVALVEEKAFEAAMAPDGVTAAKMPPIQWMERSGEVLTRLSELNEQRFAEVLGGRVMQWVGTR